MATIQVRGLSKLSKKLKQNQSLETVAIMVKLNGSEMQNTMQRKAAVDTGFMKRSITLYISDDGMTVTVKPTANYSGYVEYGTRFMEAQPFVRPAYDQQLPIFISDIIKLMK